MNKMQITYEQEVADFDQEWEETLGKVMDLMRASDKPTAIQLVEQFLKNIPEKGFMIKSSISLFLQALKGELRGVQDNSLDLPTRSVSVWLAGVPIHSEEHYEQWLGRIALPISELQKEIQESKYAEGKIDKDDQDYFFKKKVAADRLKELISELHSIRKISGIDGIEFWLESEGACNTKPNISRAKEKLIHFMRGKLQEAIDSGSWNDGSKGLIAFVIRQNKADIVKIVGHVDENTVRKYIGNAACKERGLPEMPKPRRKQTGQ